VSYAVEFVRQFVLLAWQMGPYLLLGFVVAGFLQVFIPKGWVYRQLGANSAWSVVKAAFLGAPLPLCSCGVLPVAASLKRSGASRSSIVAFLVATPVTGVDSILATYALMGGFMATVRPLAGVGIALAAGFALLAASVRAGSEPGKQDGGVSGGPAPAGGGGETAAGSAERPGFLSGTADAFRYAFGDLLAGIAGPMLVGLALGALIALVVPADFIAESVGTGFLSYLAMVGIGIPLYVCATGSIPIAAALMAKGLSAGAALAFLIAGPATNTVAMAVAKDLVGKKGAIVYLMTILVGSLGLAVLVDSTAGWMGVPITQVVAQHVHEAQPGLVEILSGYAILGLSGWHLLAPAGRKLAGRLKVGGPKEAPPLEMTSPAPSASCRHCAERRERGEG